MGDNSAMVEIMIPGNKVRFGLYCFLYPSVSYTTNVYITSTAVNL